MKKIIIYLFLSFIIISCVSSSRMVKEGIFYKTKMYVGKYEETTYLRGNYYNIRTSYFIFTLKENPEIPDSALCYMRIEPPMWDMHPDIAIQMTVTHLTWNGSDREYRIYNNMEKLLR
jgi:hypothetical protein